MLIDELHAAREFGAAAVGDSYKWPCFALVMNRFPYMIMELPSAGDHDGSLVECAVKHDCADFVRHFLLDTNGGANSQAPCTAALGRNAASILVR